MEATRVQELFLARNKRWQRIQHYEKRKLLFLVGHLSILIFYIVISEVKLRCVMQENFIGSFSLLFFFFFFFLSFFLPFFPLVLFNAETQLKVVRTISDGLSYCII